jgi:hypothetical protein
MLHLNTDAPMMVARELVGFGNGFVEQAGSESPAWVESILHVSDSSAFGVISALDLGNYRVEGRRPARVAIGDPTFAMAASSIERSNGGSAPAAAFAR